MMPAVINRRLRWLVTAWVTSMLLLACSSDKIEKTEFGIQQNLFLQSLELVEKAGSQLQRKTPDQAPFDQAQLDAALAGFDSGLRQAFQVDHEFLARLHDRLPHMYSSRFIKGVEEYRLGVTVSSREQQLNGLEKLGQWSSFWTREKSGILEKMAKFTGLPMIES